MVFLLGAMCPLPAVVVPGLVSSCSLVEQELPSCGLGSRTAGGSRSGQARSKVEVLVQSISDLQGKNHVR